MNKILTSPSSFGKISSEPLDLLEKNGYEVINNPYSRKLSKKEVIELGEDCIGIIAGVESIDQEVMDSLKKLKCISRVGVGMDSIDLEYAIKKNIEVINTPNGPTRAVAELTLGLTLSLLRKIPLADRDMKNKIWKKQTGNLLYGKKVGIIGLGRIGRMVSKLFMNMGCNIIGFDISPDLKWAEQNNVLLSELDILLRNADIICIHVSGNDEINPIIDNKEFNLLKENSILINLSRGGVVNENALYHALKNNKILGAASDVFEHEPYSGKLCNLENIILTPHIGSYAKEGKLQMEIDAVNNLIKKLNK